MNPGYLAALGVPCLRRSKALGTSEWILSISYEYWWKYWWKNYTATCKRCNYWWLNVSTKRILIVRRLFKVVQGSISFSFKIRRKASSISTRHFKVV
uniref:Uncharacterized protein n=1 Tax=Myoviridae sp. ctRTx89 TaxID=2826652 RepID=A0A8S5QSG5_9CAUD|nr:MAG TPA: hypothetical protein [Myoviridae sp. ctRTx89]